MNTELEDRLRADMERFTRDIRVPAGLPLRAYGRNRQRRRRIRVVVASGAATAVAASAVAIAGVSGAFGRSPAGPAQTVQTTAYVLRHVENALSPANIGHLVDYSRTTFPPGTIQEPAVGGANGGTTTGGASSPWTVTTMLSWRYQDSLRDSFYGPNGRHVFDAGISSANGSATQITVIYGSSTWWTATLPPGGPVSPGCAPSGTIRLSSGPGSGWPAFIRSQLSCGAYTLAGRQVVAGIDAIKVTEQTGPRTLTIFVNPATYLPIQLTMGPLRIGFRWLSATPAHLAQLKVPVPPGFRQVPPPAQP